MGESHLLTFGFLFLAVIFLIANAEETVTGFGGTIITVTLAVHFFKIDYILAVIIPTSLLLSAYIVVRHYDAIDIRELLFGILPPAAVGLGAGMAVFNLVKGPGVKIAYGVFVIGFSVVELFKVLRARGVEGSAAPAGIGRVKGVLWLLAGGVIQGIYASGGPMVVYYTSRKISDKRVFRSTLSALWLALNFALIVNYAFTGRFTVKTLVESAALIPSLVIGIILGEFLHARIPDRAFRILVFALLIIAGGSLLF
ncbi:MAG TPA: sulfite exporter TauE/SafE family protein [bacterium]|nr:sulfite exporter TauE/SafE family protein [bacterium]